MLFQLKLGRTYAALFVLVVSFVIAGPVDSQGEALVAPGPGADYDVKEAAPRLEANVQPLPVELKDALADLGISDPLHVVIETNAGSSKIYSTRPTASLTPLTVNEQEFLRILSDDPIVGSPFYFFQHRGCLRCGKYCCR